MLVSVSSVRDMPERRDDLSSLTLDTSLNDCATLSMTPVQRPPQKRKAVFIGVAVQDHFSRERAWKVQGLVLPESALNALNVESAKSDANGLSEHLPRHASRHPLPSYPPLALAMGLVHLYRRGMVSSLLRNPWNRVQRESPWGTPQHLYCC